MKITKELVLNAIADNKENFLIAIPEGIALPMICYYGLEVNKGETMALALGIYSVGLYLAYSVHKRNFADFPKNPTKEAQPSVT